MGCRVLVTPATRRLGGVVLLFCSLLVNISRGQETADPGRSESPQIESRVMELIHQLGAPRRAERAAAELELFNLGPSALDYFPPPDLVTDIAARESMLRVRLNLEHRLAKDSLKARSVTLSGTLTIKQVVTELAQQTGNRLDLSSLDAAILRRSITINWDQLSFWNGLRELRQEGVELAQESTGIAKIIPIDAGSDNMGHPSPSNVAATGPFQTRVVSLTWRGPEAENGDRVLRVVLHLECEPRLRPLYADYRDRDVQVTTTSGEARPYNPLASRQPEFRAGRDVELTLDVLVPQASAAKSMDLSGSWDVVLAALPIPISFSHLNDTFPQSRRRGGVTVALDRIETYVTGDASVVPETGTETSPKSNRRDQSVVAPATTAIVRLTARYDTGGPPFESHRVAMLHRQLYLEPMGTGGRINSDSSRSVSQGDGAFTLEYRFDKLPPDWREGTLVYEAATAIIRTKVEVFFKDLPLPGDEVAQKKLPVRPEVD
ncbi:MAG: hypothetical protein R3C01_11955 [Planctomycetaceae bacterium]